ncbi:MAG: sigma-70 family RNA polymerase sigma factor [Deltaproteobacteria bacterium]|nr:sigma-70 family RNA polymerase sigma factor [Deltaproteobacteria bacterium]
MLENELPQAPQGAPSDEALVERAKAGDFAAFEQLVSGHQERVYRLALRMMGTESDAQEVVQDALLSAWRNLKKFEGKAQFGSWLYRIAANAALMMLRTRRRHPQVSMEEVTALGADETGVDGFGAGAGDDWSKRPDDQLQSTELRAAIQAAVDALPESSRQVFMVRDVDGLSTEETAETLGLSVPAVKTRLHRARLALREAISRYFEAR